MITYPVMLIYENFIAPNFTLDPKQLTHAYVITKLVTTALTLSVFDTFRSTLDALFISVIEDLEHNNSSEEKSYFMNSKLKSIILNDILHKSKVKLEKK